MIQMFIKDAVGDGSENQAKNQPQRCDQIVVAVSRQGVAEGRSLILDVIGGLQLKVLKSRHELFRLEKCETGGKPRKSCQQTEVDREIRQQMEAVEPVAAAFVSILCLEVTFGFAEWIGTFCIISTVLILAILDQPEKLRTRKAVYRSKESV